MKIKRKDTFLRLCKLWNYLEDLKMKNGFKIEELRMKINSKEIRTDIFTSQNIGN